MPHKRSPPVYSYVSPDYSSVCDEEDANPKPPPRLTPPRQIPRHTDKLPVASSTTIPVRGVTTFLPGIGVVEGSCHRPTVYRCAAS